jgi:pimeloyl-ACP methyl ester carboxylesterase
VRETAGTKALALESLCLPRCEYLRFDYRGHGESVGTFTDTTPVDWMEDVEAAFDQLTDPAAPQIVVGGCDRGRDGRACFPGSCGAMACQTVSLLSLFTFCARKRAGPASAGSSLGGVFALHLALRRASRVAGLILVAPAVGTFAAWHAALKPGEKAALASGGSICLGSDYVSPGSDRVRLGFFEGFFEGGPLWLPEGEGAVKVPPACPVRILHGERDDVVPLPTSEALLRALASEDATLTVVKGGDHRLSGPRDLALLEAAVAQVHRQLEASGRLGP